MKYEKTSSRFGKKNNFRNSLYFLLQQLAIFFEPGFLLFSIVGVCVRTMFQNLGV